MNPVNNKKIVPFRVSIRESERLRAIQCFDNILCSGRLILGDYTKRFERDFSSFIGSNFAITTNSGSSALEIIFRSLNLSNKKILIPTNTNFATAMAAINAGATPILYDAGLYPNVQQIINYINEGIDAVVVVHIGGYISPSMPKIAGICKEYNIPLIEDAAHAHGSQLAGVAAGTFGIAAAFSFFPTKTLSTGEGGMVITNQKSIRDFAYRCRDQGKDNDNRYHILEGNSWRMSEFGAALGAILLESLDKDIAYRMKLINRYSKLLDDNDSIEFVAPSGDQLLSGHKVFGILKNSIDRTALSRSLLSKQIKLARGAYEIPLHNQPVFSKLCGGPFNDADKFCSHHIALPLWREMPISNVDTVVNNLLISMESIR